MRQAVSILTSTMRALSFWCTVMDNIKRAAVFAVFADFVVGLFVLPRFYMPAAIPVTCLLPIFFLLAFSPSRLITGDDGVQWHHFIPFVRPRFLSYGEIESFEPYRRGCTIVRRNGSILNLYTSTLSPAGAPMLGTYAQERAVAWRSKWQHEVVPALPETSGAPYRSSESTDLDMLLSIAAMPHAPPGIRIAAAERLASSTDADVRTALEALSSAAAEPNVREALRRASRGDPSQPKDQAAGKTT